MDRVRVLILGLLSVVLLVGCTTTRYVPVPSVSVDSVYVDRWLPCREGLGLVGEDEALLFSRARGDCCRECSVTGA